MQNDRTEKGSAPNLSTFCFSVFIKPPIDAFPGPHLPPLPDPFPRHRPFPAQPPRQGDLHRAALAPQPQIGFLPARLFQPRRHQPHLMLSNYRFSHCCAFIRVSHLSFSSGEAGCSSTSCFPSEAAVRKDNMVHQRGACQMRASRRTLSVRNAGQQRRGVVTEDRARWNNSRKRASGASQNARTKPRQICPPQKRSVSVGDPKTVQNAS